MPSERIAVWSAFDPTAGGHGGNLRSAQLTELLEHAGFTYHRVDREGGARRWHNLRTGLSAILAARRDGLHASIRSAGLVGWQIRATRAALSQEPRARVFLWEDTSAWAPAWAARQLGFTTVAAPHNLESLAAGHVSTHGLRREIQALRLAECVFCISPEEEWLLASFGLTCATLPYWPASSRARELKVIADERRQNPPGDTAPLLILGTAHNRPTLRGMEAQLRWLAEANIPMPVVVAGFGTEALASMATARVTIRGSVEATELARLLAGCRALLVHQTRGAGALTRIPEAILAGVPVVANTIAARGTPHLPGVLRYADVTEFFARLAEAPRWVPAPAMPDAAFRTFQTKLRALARSRPA